jgi:hypothetical protein
MGSAKESDLKLNGVGGAAGSLQYAQKRGHRERAGKEGQGEGQRASDQEQRFAAAMIVVPIAPTSWPPRLTNTETS